MKLRKTLSICLALTLILGLLAPGGAFLHAHAQTTLYGGNLEQVTEPVIGESYYLGADVNGTMMYFRHGTVTDTVPYSLVVTDNIDHNWCMKLTLEDSTKTSENFEGGFQFAYVNPTSDALTRIYCMDVLKTGDQTGIMDTGLNTNEPYQNRHSFFVDDLDGNKILRKYGNDNILVIMQVPQTVNGETAMAWRMLGVPESALGNEGVYPVMMLKEHKHSFGSVTKDDVLDTASRTCATCGYVETVYDSKLIVAENIKVGKQYYLAANAGDKMIYVRHGVVTETTPYSLPALEDVNHSWVLPMTFAAPTEGDTGFRITYTHPTSGAEANIYCYDVGNNGTIDTGVNSTPALNTHTYFVDTVDGVRVLRSLGNNYILAIKRMEQTSSGVTSEGWRMLGVAEAELGEGVYPVVVMEAHDHAVGTSLTEITDEGHKTECWCGGNSAAVAHTYGAVKTDAANKTSSRTCTVCGYTNVIYGYDYQQVQYPVVGESYYLTANVAGSLKYFTTGTVTNTAPYSLVTTESASKAVKVAIESSTKTSEKFEGGFQFTFDNNGNVTRIYCMDVLKDATTAGQTGIMDTGTQTGTAYKNRHSFFVDEVNGVKVLRKYGNNNILVVKYNETTKTYRMLGVPEAELSNTGVYPVSVTAEHTHTYNAWIANDDGTNSQICTACGFEEIYYGNDTKVSQVENPVIGESYYLAADVEGTIYFFRHGAVTDTVPYSLVVTDNINHNWTMKVGLESSLNTDESFEGGFQFTYTNPTNDTLARIYCMDVLKDATVAGQTGIMDTGVNTTTPYKNRHSFFVDDLDGNKILRKYGNDSVLVVMQVPQTVDGETAMVWRMLGVPESALGNEGVYPVMLANAHTHSFSKEYYANEAGHWHVCECGSTSAVETHTVADWTVITPPTATEPGSKTGLCTVCGNTAVAEAPVTVDSWNIVLGDNIGVNFVLALTKGDKVEIKVAGEKVAATLKDNGNGTSTVFIKLAAAQMSDEISISVNGHAVEKTYSVRAYADAILAGEYTNYTKELVKNMLAFGGAAQNAFNYNTANMANAGIEVTAAVPGAAPELEVLSELEGVAFYGASLLHKEKTSVRFYFTADSVEGLTFQVDGNVYEPVAKNDMYYIEVAGINPQDLDDVLHAVVTDGTNSLAVKYSPLIYIARMYNKADTSAATKAVVQAMYGYHLAAKAYLANLNLADDFAVKSQTQSTLYEGVTLHEKVYVAAGYGEVEAYILQINADAGVELKVSAGAKTVANHFRAVKNAGNNVLAMINGGFFDLNQTGSYLPYGMQVVDGVVNQEPSADRNNYSDNWFGMTKDGKYVISNAAGYASTYAGNVQQAVGGGKLLIVDGVPVDLTSDRAYRTAVGVNANGDLVMVAVADATYSDVCHIFVDMGLDIVTVLNLDGGGSTAMYVPGAYYPKAKILGDDGWFPREVADAIAIVEKN